jgi:hypothetical protein
MTDKQRKMGYRKERIKSDMVGACSTHGQLVNAYRNIVANFKSPCGRPRCKWEENIKKNLK